MTYGKGLCRKYILFTSFTIFVWCVQRMQKNPTFLNDDTGFLIISSEGQGQRPYANESL